ncbi:SDR family oxidoreductase, partial [Psychromonas sp.]|uniref:SDR family oxidoreductase n=1 Tax=Psychromonas sp. TaxID=1884585 RepID=UPI003A9737C1
TTANSVEAQLIEQTMLAVVADKTGYPTEMLELSMDMEADLGIDSIKRVEILGAVQDQVADLPELDAEQLAQMRTLEEIVAYMNSVMGVTNANTVQATEEAPQTIDVEHIERTMLSVVADKTGYPTEMLELSMNMEADLGIDSIKRVEILGGVQDQISALPELDAEQLSQMSTLAEIVNYMHSVQADNTSVITVNTLSHASYVPLTETFEPAPSATVAIKKLSALEYDDSSVKGETDGSKQLLLVNDGLDSCVLTANELIKAGWKVTVLTPHWIKVKLTKQFDQQIQLVDLPSLDEAIIADIMSAQQWQSVIYLHPKTNAPGIDFDEQDKQGLQLVFLLAKLCKLNQLNNEVCASFLVVTRQGGDFATNNLESKADLVQGGLSGLVKTLAQEWNKVFCRIVDLPCKFTTSKVAKIVVSELNDKATLPTEVGYNSEGRLTLVAQKTDSYQLTDGQSINQESVFLVSGGAKGVTAHCIIELAKQHQSKFILLGRSQYQADEGAWSMGIDTDVDLKKAAMQHLLNTGQKPNPKSVKQLINTVLANREIKQTLHAISLAGGVAEYVAADVCDKQALQTAVAPITALWGSITGVIHGAGVLADKLIEDKTLSEFEQVYSTKIDGLAALLSCCEMDKLTHLALFSSAAGFYGNPAQSDYAIANEILNKTAYRFKALYPAVQVLSFNWGPWDGGMVTAELKHMFNQRGVYIIPVESGAKLFASELAAVDNRCVQVVVGTDMSGSDNEPESIKVDGQIIKVFNHQESMLLSDHQIDGQPVLPTVCAMAWLKSACEQQYPDYQYQGVKDFKLFKGVVFDGAHAEQFMLDTKLVERSDTQLNVEVLVSSKTAQGKLVYHYQGIVTLVKPLDGGLSLKEHQTILPEFVKKQSQQAAELYADGSLFHGQSLQGIQHIHQLDETGLLLECAIEMAANQGNGEFDLNETNVAANDLVYQALLVWTSKQLGTGSLPTSTGSWDVFREVKLGEHFFIKLIVTKQQGQSVFGDLLLIDQANKVISQISAAEVTCSPSLSELFKASA